MKYITKRLKKLDRIEKIMRADRWKHIELKVMKL
jgi:hypothetical protein